MKKEFYSLLTFAGILFSSTMFAQSTQIFLKVDGIDGPSMDKVHAKEFEVFAFSHGSANPVVIQSGKESLSAGKVNSSGFTFQTNLSAGVLELKKRLYMGQSIPFVEVSCRKTDRAGNLHEYYKIRLDQVTVTSLSESAGGELPVVSIELTPVKITWTYNPEPRPGGLADKKATFGWDLTTNKSMQ